MKHNIPSLNGLRAISISMVILYHFNIHNYLPKQGIIKQIATIFFNGPLGVTVFFLISGFLITTLLIKEEEATKNISLKKFYYRRMIRIFPAYYFLLLVYFILTCFKYFSISPTDWISDITYTKQFFKNDSIFETRYLWSLSVEEVFYLIWPAIFIYFRKHIIYIIFFVIICCSFLRYSSYQYPVLKLDEIIYTSADALLIGCLFAIKYDEIALWLLTRKRLFFLVLMLFGFSVLIYTYLYHRESVVNDNKTFALHFKFLLPISYALFGQIGSVTNLLLANILIYSINIKNLWFKFLNHPVLNHIGKLSYSLYLWQQLFTADRVYLHSLPIVVLILFIFAAAYFSYYLIEKPFLRLKHQYEAVR